jgi:hypothetical protein
MTWIPEIMKLERLFGWVRKPRIKPKFSPGKKIGHPYMGAFMYLHYISTGKLKLIMIYPVFSSSPSVFHHCH